MTSEDVRAGTGVRLYRATADSHWILAKDGWPSCIPVRSPDLVRKRGQESISRGSAIGASLPRPATLGTTRSFPEH
jgi:hypothetical protein